MRNLFISKVLSDLQTNFTSTELQMIEMKLLTVLEDFDISYRCTALAVDNLLYELMKMYMVTKKIEGIMDSSLKLYGYYIKHFVDTVIKPIDKLTNNDIRLYLYQLQCDKRLSNRTLESRRIVIVSFLKWCQEEGYIKSNITKGIKSIKFQPKMRDPLTLLELEKLRESCHSLRDKALLEVLYSTGCRVSEFINLKKEDISLVDKEVHIVGKGNKFRMSYLSVRATLALRNYWNSRQDNSEYAFVSLRKPHGKLCKEAVERVLRQIGEDAGINRHVHPHLLRHTVATTALSRGMNIAEIQRFLGHATMDTTLIYAKVVDESVKINHKKYV